MPDFVSPFDRFWVTLMKKPPSLSFKRRGGSFHDFDRAGIQVVKRPRHLKFTLPD